MLPDVPGCQMEGNMGDLFKTADQIVPWIKVAACVGGGLACLLAVGIIIYILHTTYAPLIRGVQWVCFYTPGEKPHPALAGVAHGLRLVIWAGVLGTGLWIAIHSIWS